MRSEIAFGSAPSSGSSSASATIVIFSDFQCPYCRQAAAVITREVIPQTNDRARVIFRHLPLDGHEWARPAAEAAACAFQQGNEHFWSFHEMLFAKQSELNTGNIAEIVREHARLIPAFNVREFDACVTGGTGRKLVDADLALARAAGVSGTPAVFVNGQQTSWQANHLVAAVLKGTATASSSSTGQR